MMRRLRAWIELGRVSNLPAVWSNCVIAWFLAGGGIDGDLVWVCAAASLFYFGGTTWNDAYDAEFDREHRRERPVPSGRLGLPVVWRTGGIALAGGLAVFAFLPSADVLFVLALLVAIVFYDFIHKKSPLGVWVM